MKKTLLVVLISTFLNAGLFGDTEEEQRIGQQKLIKLMTRGENHEITKLYKVNQKLKKLLSKRHINYKIPLQNMRREQNIKKITNRLIITEKEELKILRYENKELKRLIEINYIK